jgi:hypothetical protein
MDRNLLEKVVTSKPTTRKKKMIKKAFIKTIAKGVTAIALCLIGFVSYGQSVQQITIQPIKVGNVGQYTVNALNVVPRPVINIATDTTVTVDCYLVFVSGNNTTAIPDEWGKFTVTLSFPLATERTNATLLSWRNAILTAPNPDLIIR